MFTGVFHRPLPLDSFWEIVGLGGNIPEDAARLSSASGIPPRRSRRSDAWFPWFKLHLRLLSPQHRSRERTDGRTDGWTEDVSVLIVSTVGEDESFAPYVAEYPMTSQLCQPRLSELGDVVLS